MITFTCSVNHPRDIFVFLFLKRARPSNNHVIDGELVFSLMSINPSFSSPRVCNFQQVLDFFAVLVELDIRREDSINDLNRS